MLPWRSGKQITNYNHKEGGDGGNGKNMVLMLKQSKPCQSDSSLGHKVVVMIHVSARRRNQWNIRSKIRRINITGGRLRHAKCSFKGIKAFSMLSRLNILRKKFLFFCQWYFWQAFVFCLTVCEGGELVEGTEVRATHVTNRLPTLTDQHQREQSRDQYLHFVTKLWFRFRVNILPVSKPLSSTRGHGGCLLG